MSNHKGNIRTYTLVFVVLLLSFSQLNADDRASGYAIYGPITINTMMENFSDYRIVPVSQAPNPSFLEIPEGGFGYAWFVVEGQLNGIWLPATGVDLVAQDAQGNLIDCETGLLPFQFLTSIVHMQNAGVFAVPIPSSIVGDGNPCSVETIEIIQANGLVIAPENRQSIFCGVVPYEYTADWGYRIYAKGGAGLTAGVVTGTGFAGGGSGATISLDLQGLADDPEWSAFKINRRDDIFVGAELSLGPPTLIDFDTASASVTASFPYEREYEFDLDAMDGLEALMAYYLFAEPTLIYASGPIPGGQITVSFLSWVVNALIANNANNGLGIARTADELGLDIEGCIELGIDNLDGLPFNLEMSPGLGASSHFGGSIKEYTDGKVKHKLSLGGEINATPGIGPQIVPAVYNSTKFFFPNRITDPYIPTTVAYGADYEITGTWQGWDWQSIELSGSLESNNPILNLYDLPGQYQKYTSTLSIDDVAVKNALFNVSQTPQKMWDIGSTAVNAAIDNNSFSTDFTNFLGEIYDQQNQELPVQLGYKYDCSDKSSFSLDLDFEFPLPVFPALVINLGGGISMTNSRQFDLSEGYWVKGYPYLQTEMPNPPYPGVTFPEVITGIWDKMVTGDIWTELSDVILADLAHRIITWLGNRTIQVELLNNYGSTITITENSIPTEVDSIQFRYWEWGDEPRNQSLSSAQRDKITSYNRNLRKTREDALGMRYGIGGFYRFEANAAEWNDDPLLKIVYNDSEIVGIDESSLALYWEDEIGNWHNITSTVVPDSNYVYANIPYFSTYTLAPRLPQGDFSLVASPDSLLADGVSTATITSGALQNNDGTMVADGTHYTVSTSRGQIVTPDADATMAGVQVAVFGNVITFCVQADSVALPIAISASSSQGYSSGSIILNLYQTTPPTQPTLLAVQPEHRALLLTWQEVDDPGVVGYKIYYDVDASGAPYNGTSNVSGLNSPVIVGQTDNYILTGLYNNDTYYVAVTTVDAYGLESPVSNEMQAQPVLRAVQSLNIEPVTTGMKLTWQPSFGAENYKIYRADSPNAPIGEMTLVGQTSSLFWTDTSVQTNYRGFYVVVAVGY